MKPAKQTTLAEKYNGAAGGALGNADASAEELVKVAQRRRLGRRGAPYVDNKALCSIDHIVTLLDAGAEPRRLNSIERQEDVDVYGHEVTYDGHVFQAITHQYVKELERYRQEE